MKNFDYFEKFRSKLILLELNNGQKHLGIVKNVVKNALSIDCSGADKIFRFDEIKNLSYKKVIFIETSKLFSEKIFDAFSTKIIEELKNGGHYVLMTRSAVFDKKNGEIKKQKLTRIKFKLIVYEWLQNRKKHIEICPLALINQKYLLCIHQGIFCLIEKNYKIVFESEKISIVDFVFSKNEELISFKQKELNSTFKGILDLL